MNKLKFSYDYPKLFMAGIIHKSRVNLLDVIPIKLEDLSDNFKKYDTRLVPLNEYYPLPKKGNYLLLIFLNPNNGIFTTLRRSTPSKLKYYRSQIGQNFEVTTGE